MKRLSFNKSEMEGTVGERFARVVAHNPDALAVVDAAGALSYGQLHSQARAIARQIAGGYTGGRSAPALHVALLFGYSAGGIAAALGALQAGRCYAPFNASDTQLAAQIEDAEPGMILTDDQHLQTAAILAAGRIPTLSVYPPVTIDPLDAGMRDEDDMIFEAPPVGVRSPNPAMAPPESPCVLLYTSGSSGRPKGVHHSHRSVLYGGWIQGNYYGIHPEDRIAQVFHPASGGALGDIDAALLNGASLWLFDPATTGIEHFKEWLRRSRITILHPPVSFFRAFADSIAPGEAMYPSSSAMYPSSSAMYPSPFPDLRLIVLAGQTVRPDDIDRFRERFLPGPSGKPPGGPSGMPPGGPSGMPSGGPSGLRMVNRLASSEGGGILTHFFFEATTEISTETVPVGYANEDIGISIHDDDGVEVADGEPGEIFVRSPYAAQSYWRRPELDADRFPTDPDDPTRRIVRTGDLGRRHPDGLIEHLGRKDLMVKIRGFRVELAAVESALLAVEGVSEAVVVSASGSGQALSGSGLALSGDDGYIARGDGYIAKAQGEPRLIAYLVASDPALTPTVAHLRDALKSKLPNAALPAGFVFLDSLPLTTTGKPDRVSLAGRPIPSFRPNLDVPYRAPVSAAETRIAAIWSEVLEIDGLGVDDPFLDLGGNSILAARIVARVLSDRTLSPKPGPAEPGQSISVAKLFATPTVAGMAALVQAGRNDDAGRLETLAELLAEVEARTDEQAEQDLYLENHG